MIAAGGSNPPSVLTGKDLVVGTGTTAGPNDTVQVQYVGSLYSTGKVFDASWTDNGPATFPLSGVVPGFKDAIVGMKVGGRREIVIPPADGYGAAGSPPAIPPDATLVFGRGPLDHRVAPVAAAAGGGSEAPASSPSFREMAVTWR